MIEENDNKIKVRLEVASSLAVIFGTETSRWLIFHREVEQGSVVGDLLTVFALSYPQFRKAVFDPMKREMNQQINISLSGVLLESSKKIETVLSAGDRITLIPSYTNQVDNSYSS
jgi:molybdopterin converting factor small subunit